MLSDQARWPDSASAARAYWERVVSGGVKFTQNGRFEIVQGKGAGTAAEPRHLRRLVAIGPPLLAGNHAAHGAEEQAEEDEEERTAEEEEALGSKKTQEEQKRWFSDRPNQTTIRSPLTRVGELIRRTPSWAEDQYLDSLNTLRWTAQFFLLQHAEHDLHWERLEEYLADLEELHR